MQGTHNPVTLPFTFLKNNQAPSNLRAFLLLFPLSGILSPRSSWAELKSLLFGEASPEDLAKATSFSPLIPPSSFPPFYYFILSSCSPQRQLLPGVNIFNCLWSSPPTGTLRGSLLYLQCLEKCYAHRGHPTEWANESSWRVGSEDKIIIHETIKNERTGRPDQIVYNMLIMKYQCFWMTGWQSEAERV